MRASAWRRLFVAPGVTAGISEPLSGRREDWGFVPNSKHQLPEVMAQTEQELKRFNALWHGPTDDKVIYLTFDGGGDSRETPHILETLKRQQVKVMFFITGDFLDQSPAMIKRMAAEGHGIGNHTVTHPHLNEQSPAQFDTEVDTVADQVKALTGKRPVYFRCPFGTYSEAVLGRLQAKGYRTAFWSIAMVDWLPMAGGKNQAVHGVLDHLHNGAVVLLHAGSADDVNALEDIIVRTRGEGYRFGDPETL